MGEEAHALIEDTDKKNAEFEREKRKIQEQLPKQEGAA
jgi:hypothetical protein